MWTRRKFIQSSLASALSIYAFPKVAAARFLEPFYLGGELPRFERTRQPKKVIILGAGVAGLCAGYELAQAGHQVVLLELTRRTGGRVFTLRNYFGNQIAELGATRIPDTHFLTLGYAKKFGLEIKEFPYSDQNALYHLFGNRFTHHSVAQEGYPASFQLTPEERALGPEDLISYYTRIRLEQVGDPRQNDWPQPAQRDFDKYSFCEYLARGGASHSVLTLAKAIEGSEIETYNGLIWLAAEKLDAKWEHTYAIRGGNDQLPGAFARELGDRILLGAKVTQVAQTGQKVSVSYVRDGIINEVTGDAVISTIPIPLMKEIEFRPGLSDLKLQAIRDIQMRSVVRINLQFKRRFWNQEEGLKGLLIAGTDFLFERLWDMTAVQDGEQGILTGYVQYQNADTLGRYSSQAEVIERSLTMIERIFPQARREFTKGFVWKWQAQPWVQGGWASYLPNQVHLFQALQQPHGKVVFAGDHTSIYCGWIQGALESAHLAVNEVIHDR